MYHLQPLAHRISLLLLLLAAALLIITGRLFYLQVWWGTYYTHRGERNFLRTETIPSQRGTIYDCTGKLLATNRPITHIMWNGSGNPRLSDDQRMRLHSIEKISGQPLTHSLLTSIEMAERRYQQIAIAHDVTVEQLSKMSERYPEDPNIGIQTEFERYYPYGSCASHIVGYLSKQIDAPQYGKMGIERLCDERLKGQEGMVLKTINSMGRDIAAVPLHDSLSGNDIRTTIDLELQRIAERSFPSERTGCLLIMDPQDGALKAVVSRPSFDPSLFLKPISHQTWQELQHKKPFLNRMLNPYPPGSIFKLVTISAAMEHGLLYPDQIWQCDGFAHFAKRKYWCHRRWGHGEITTRQAIAQSCNVLFYEIGKKIDIDLIADYAHRFGLGESTGCAFNEALGIVPSREWKLTNRGEHWWQGETLSVMIGQSFLLSTPLQIARMISSIFTGYLVKPRILMQEQIAMEPLLIEQDTLDFLKQSMQLVVTKGTGRNINTIKDIEIYAKTSTAQISDISKRKLSPDYLEHAWFVAYFHYQDHAPLVFLFWWNMPAHHK